MLSLLLTLAIFGFVAWVILQIPMPEPVRNIILGVICLILVIWVLQFLGVETGFRRGLLR